MRRYKLKFPNDSYPQDIEIYKYGEEKPYWLTDRLLLVRFSEEDGPIYNESVSEDGVTYYFPEYGGMYVPKNSSLARDLFSGCIFVIKDSILESLYKPKKYKKIDKVFDWMEHLLNKIL